MTVATKTFCSEKGVNNTVLLEQCEALSHQHLKTGQCEHSALTYCEHSAKQIQTKRTCNSMNVAPVKIFYLSTVDFKET